ncbi:MAG: hypothetical protein J3R72DRAFT_433638 [Linnemannia gamsii]|nr:MAG: hypothetical protein J3R72DRAFT_433638 [Linnemannia gamsii]
MDALESSLIRVIRLPELFDAIVRHLVPNNIHTLRLVNTLFLEQCSPYFSITLNLERKWCYPNLKNLAESALAIEEGAVMATTGRADETSRKQSSHLDLIQGLKISRDRNPHKSMTPEIVSILNQCGNLRHILIKDDHRGTTESPEKQSYPARLLWSSMLPEVQGGRGGGDGGAGGSENGEQLWTFWDLLPLEGRLFDRLESLTIDMGYHTQLDLNRFMPRLGCSRAAKTLGVLTMTATASNTRKVSWEVFRDCISNLSVLKTLRMNNAINIIYTKDPIIDSDDGSQYKMVTQLRQVAPTVHVLECALGKDRDPDFKLAFMSLFPNLESLKVSDLGSLLDKAVDERVYSEICRQLPLQQSPLGQQYSTGSVEGNGSPPYQIPFPLLRSLNCGFFYANDWPDSQVLRHWIQRAPNFRLACLQFSDQDVKMGLHEELSTYSVSLGQISITATRNESVKELLSSHLCRNLEILECDNWNVHCARVLFCLEDPLKSTMVALDQAGSASPSPPSISDVPFLSQQDLFTRFPWTQTLTALKFKKLVPFSARSKGEVDPSVASLRSFLKLLPRLVDFEVVNPIDDLSVFEGLGRQSTTSSIDDPTDAARLSERPWLTRLKVCQSRDSKDRITGRSMSDTEKVAPWRNRLSFQFRFLKTLVVDREYNNNGGYDPGNFVGGVDWDLYD